MALWKWALILLAIAIPVLAENWLIPRLHLGKPPDARWIEYWQKVGPAGTSKWPEPMDWPNKPKQPDPKQHP